MQKVPSAFSAFLKTFANSVAGIRTHQTLTFFSIKRNFKTVSAITITISTTAAPPNR